MVYAAARTRRVWRLRRLSVTARAPTAMRLPAMPSAIVVQLVLLASSAIVAGCAVVIDGPGALSVLAESTAVAPGALTGWPARRGCAAASRASAERRSCVSRAWTAAMAVEACMSIGLACAAAGATSAPIASAAASLRVMLMVAVLLWCGGERGRRPVSATFTQSACSAPAIGQQRGRRFRADTGDSRLQAGCKF